jgi:hypothetical protein
MSNRKLTNVDLIRFIRQWLVSIQMHMLYLLRSTRVSLGVKFSIKRVSYFWYINLFVSIFSFNDTFSFFHFYFFISLEMFFL